MKSITDDLASYILSLQGKDAHGNSIKFVDSKNSHNKIKDENQNSFSEECDINQIDDTQSLASTNLNESEVLILLKREPIPEEFINVKELSLKSLYKKLSNSELILCLLEVIHHSEKHMKYQSPKSPNFWYEACTKEELRYIFKNFKPDTLRQYWKKLSQIDDLYQIPRVLLDHKDLLESNKIK